MSLTREQILAARRNRKPERMEVPEWGGDVFLKVLTAQEQSDLSEGVTGRELMGRLLIRSIVDEDGNRLLRDEDFGALMEHEFPVIVRVFGEAARLNGMTNRELEEAIQHLGRRPGDERSSDSR